MQTPPPFHGYEGQQQPPQKKKSNVVVIIFAILGVLLVCCGLPLGFVAYNGMKAFKGAMAIGGCSANVNSMKSALHEYSRTHDGKLPSAATWQTDIGKYLKTTKDAENVPMKFWKPGGEWSCEEGNTKTGFMFNSDLSEKKVADVTKNDIDAIAIFETKTVAFNQSGKLNILPFAESPKILGDFLKERRGWMLVSADATHVYAKDAKGNLGPFDMNMRGKGGFDLNTDSTSDSKSSKDSGDSNDSKSDNSN